MNVFMSGIHFQLLLLSLVTRPGNLVNSILQVQYTLAESGDFSALSLPSTSHTSSTVNTFITAVL